MTNSDETAPVVLEPTVEPSKAMQVASNPFELLAMMASKGADLDTLKQFMELQERYEANEARKAYNAAVAEFKKNPPDIIKDKKNNQYNSMYATLANLVNNGSAALAPYGLTVDWKIDQEKMPQIKVTCILKHALGHSESVSITGLPDESGAKNKLQQIKSTITYLKGETFQCVTGITARDCPGDNDGNGAGRPSVEQQKGRSVDKTKPTDGAWDGISDEGREYLKRCGATAIDVYEADGVGSAHSYLEGLRLDSEEKIALWTLLPSQMRTALKKANPEDHK